MTILRLSDNKVYTKDQLGELLRDEGTIFNEEERPYLSYSTLHGWEVAYDCGRNEPVWNSRPLDPAKYSVTPAGCVPISDVKACYDEIMAGITYAVYPTSSNTMHGISRSAFSKILGETNEQPS